MPDASIPTGSNISRLANRCRTFHPLPRPRFTFDRVRIVSSQSVRRLRQVLPLKALRYQCHSLRVFTIYGGPEWAQSIIEFVHPASIVFWNLILASEARLGRYSICHLELAFDFAVSSEKEALDIEIALICNLRKLWHQEADLWFEYSPDDVPPAGCTRNPTFYFEQADCSTALKVYSRHQKRLRHAFELDRIVVRLEWTLYRARSVVRATGIASISDLVGYYSGDFLRRNLRFEYPKLEDLGLWLLARLPARARVRNRSPLVHANNFLDTKARGDPQVSMNWELTRDVKWRCSSQIRGFLRSERARARSYRGKLPAWERDIGNLTDYRLNSFFDDVTEQMAPWLEDF